MTDPADDKARRKAALRGESLTRRDGLDLDERLDWDKAITARVLALPVLAEPGTGLISAYWPLRSEVDPRPILEDLHGRGLPLCLPVVVAGRMTFRAWAPWRPIVPGGFGTLVPVATEPEVEPSILLVPLAAFDRRGYRIGYGKGHYDAALEQLRPLATVGLAYAAQEIAAVPDEAHDRRLDWVVTERETIDCRVPG